MLSKLKKIIALVGALTYSVMGSAEDTTNFARKNNSDQIYYYVAGFSDEFPVEKFEKSEKFVPFYAKNSLIVFGNELEYLSSLQLDTTYKGKLITEDTIKEITDKIVESLQNRDYLFMCVELDKFAARDGILKLDIKLMNIEDVSITGPGATDKQMMLNARKLKEESSPAKLSVTETYIWRMKRVKAYFSSFRFVETENHTINLIVDAQKNMY